MSTNELTDERIRQVLDIWPTILKRAKGNERMLAVPPTLGAPGTDFFAAIGPQLDKLYGDVVDDVGSVFRDHSRIIEIFGVIQRGGLAGELARVRAMGGNAFLDDVMAKMQASGTGNPDAVRDMLPQMKRNSEIMAARLESITEREIELVTKYSAEIEKSIRSTLP